MGGSSFSPSDAQNVRDRDRASAAKSWRGPDLHYGVVEVTGVQTLVGRFVRGARFVAVRQTFVLCGQATPCASRVRNRRALA